MTQHEMETIILNLLDRVNQQSAQIAALEGLLASMPIDSQTFNKAHKIAGRWHMPRVPGVKGFPPLHIDELEYSHYIARIEEKVTGKPVD